MCIRDRPRTLSVFIVLWNYAQDQLKREANYAVRRKSEKTPNETIFVLAKIQTFLTKYNFCVY